MESANNVCEHFVFSALSHFAIHLYAKQELFTSGSRDRHQYNLFRFIVPILMQDMPFWSFRNDFSFFWCSVFSKTSAAVIKRSRKQSIPWLDMTIHPLFGAVSFSLMILLITTPQIPIYQTHISFLPRLTVNSGFPLYPDFFSNCLMIIEGSPSCPYFPISFLCIKWMPICPIPSIKTATPRMKFFP